MIDAADMNERPLKVGDRVRSWRGRDRTGTIHKFIRLDWRSAYTAVVIWDHGEATFVELEELRRSFVRLTDPRFAPGAYWKGETTQTLDVIAFTADVAFRDDPVGGWVTCKPFGVTMRDWLPLNASYVGNVADAVEGFLREVHATVLRPRPRAVEGRVVSWKRRDGGVVLSVAIAGDVPDWLDAWPSYVTLSPRANP